MKEFIPFVRSRTDCEILNRAYAGVSMVRVTLEDIEPIAAGLPAGVERWIDPGVDGLHHYLHKEPPAEFPAYLQRFDRCEQILQIDLSRPDRPAVRAFVFSVLDQCLRHKPRWITLPQLPVVDDASRNKLNRLLAELTHEWCDESGFDGQFVLPLIFTKRDQLRNRTQWKSKIDLALACMQLSGAEHLWTADASLSDESGAASNKDRLPANVQFHRELRDALSASIRPLTLIGGPYWAMNLILWARGLIDLAAVSLGSLYTYCLSGIPTLPREGTTHLIIPFLKRRAYISDALKQWLDDTLDRLEPQSPEHNQVLGIRENFDLLTDETVAARHTAGFYRDWLGHLVDIDASARPLDLYEDFSAANKLGSKLTRIPITADRRQDAGLVARQLMLACL